MDPTLASSVGQFGLAGIVFVIWFYDQKKIDGLQDVLKEQIEEKKLLRDDRSHLLGLISEQAKLIERTANILDRVERRLGTVIDKVVS